MLAHLKRFCIGTKCKIRFGNHRFNFPPKKWGLILFPQNWTCLIFWILNSMKQTGSKCEVQCCMVCYNWLNGASNEQWLLSKALHTINNLRDLQKNTESPSRAMPMLGGGTCKSYSKRIRKSYLWHSKLYLGYFDLQAGEELRHFS